MHVFAMASWVWSLQEARALDDLSESGFSADITKRESNILSVFVKVSHLSEDRKCHGRHRMRQLYMCVNFEALAVR